MKRKCCDACHYSNLWFLFLPFSETVSREESQLRLQVTLPVAYEVRIPKIPFWVSKSSRRVVDKRSHIFLTQLYQITTWIVAVTSFVLWAVFAHPWPNFKGCLRTICSQSARKIRDGHDWQSLSSDHGACLASVCLWSHHHVGAKLASTNMNLLRDGSHSTWLHLAIFHCLPDTQWGRGVCAIDFAMLRQMLLSKLFYVLQTPRSVSYIEGILPIGPYLSCVSIAGRALLAGYPRSGDGVLWYCCLAKMAKHRGILLIFCWGNRDIV